MASKVLRIPVVSIIPGMVDALLETVAKSANLFGAVQVELKPISMICQQNGVWTFPEELVPVLKETEIVVGDAFTVGPWLLSPSTSIAPHQQDLFRNVKWVQNTFAGVELYPQLVQQHKLETPKFTVTRAGGILPLAMAQYVLGWIVVLERKFLSSYENQKIKNYARFEGFYRDPSKVLVGILGFGDIGRGVGRILRTTGFQVLGYKRKITPEFEEATKECATRLTEDMNEILQTADYIVSILPSTPDTRGLLNTENLKLCAAKKPVLINVGRGDLLTTSTIIEALDQNWLSQTVLDVFEEEPLPEDSPLWTHPKVNLTPHTAAVSIPSDMAQVFVRNLQLFEQQNPLDYTLDWTTGY